MRKIIITMFAIFIFAYVLSPFKSTAPLPEGIVDKDSNLFCDINDVQIDGYRVYNAGILPIEDGYLYVTRKSGASMINSVWRRFFLKKNVKVLEIGELDKNFLEKDTPKTSYKSNEIRKGFPIQYIDARLLYIGTDIYMVYCRADSFRVGKDREACLHLAKIVKVDGVWKVCSDVPLLFEETSEFYKKGLVTKGFEKNWIPFCKDGELYFVYLMDPEHIILKADIKSGETSICSRNKNTFDMGFTNLRGSTPAVFDEELGEWIALFHFAVPIIKTSGRARHAYFAGGYTFSKEKPFKIIRKSKGAFYGEELYNNHKKIIFPVALIRDGDSYLVFYGEDDERNRVARVSRKELIASMEAVDGENNDRKTD